MSSFARKAYCFCANAISVGAIAVFALGFFPHKAFLPGLATWPAADTSLRAPAPFDKVIFMVVDALRSDFVYGEAGSFKYVQSLIRSGAAVPFTGHASPPTITMPRVKAITTGSVPSFLDLVLNFAESDTSATLAAQDTWLAQMRVKPNSKLVMYGDDTWLRLFPGFFDRADGTTSFFVSDFTEVDNNVTRHVPDELVQDDWTVMVLHFLGLDHIGHKTGPRGPNMPGKQREMDGIVETIYKSMKSQPHLESSLLVLLGDHGMNEAGNHGASSAGEVSTVLTFISPKLESAFDGLESPLAFAEDFRYYEAVEQSDIAPTLAALLGFPVPRNNLGIMIPTLLGLWTQDRDKLDLVYENAQQMHQVAMATFPEAFSMYHSEESCREAPSNDIEDLACAWLHARLTYSTASTDASSVKTAILAVRMFLKKAQDTLSGTASNYNLNKMYVGIGLATLAATASALAAGPSLDVLSFPGLAFVSIILVYGITMFASSYVEEEHQFWYWTLGGWLTIMQGKASRFESSHGRAQSFSIAGVALLSGVIRRWNQTGQKYAGDPDLVTQFLSKHPWMLWILIFFTYLFIAESLSRRAATWGKSKQMALLPVIVCTIAFAFKLAFAAEDAPELLTGVPLFNRILMITSRYSLVGIARAVFLGMAHIFACAIFYEAPWKESGNRQKFLRGAHDLLTLFLITQTRTVNIPLFLLFSAQFSLLDNNVNMFRDTELTITSLLFQYSSFYALGGTNAISSVDLSNAYNGVGGYNATAVGVLTFMSNWAGPIWWVSATCCMLTSRSFASQQEATAFSHFARLTLFATMSTLAVMLACLFLREHLFIWTVFSPKYLYSIAWVMGHHIMVNGIFALFVFGAEHV